MTTFDVHRTCGRSPTFRDDACAFNMNNSHTVYGNSKGSPNVPSAPMNSLVVSKPAADFRARRLVLITFPLGSTTVLIDKAKSACIYLLGNT